MENKQTKNQKIPGVFRKPVKSKKFEKRFLKFLEHPEDRKFFISCFEKHDDEYVIRTSLDKNDVKKLSQLVKDIKANRKGAVKFIPLAFASAIVAAVVIFFTIFANPLLERALEKGLEAIFEAKSDVEDFRLSLLRFRISIKSITVANRDAPMTNLFQMGRAEIRLKPEAVLRGKIYIEEIRADTIRFGTARSVSGALVGITPREKQEREKREAPPLVDLRNFDVMALLNQEYEKLNTPKLYDQAINTYDEAVVKWENQVESTKAAVGNLQSASQPLLNLNANAIRDIETIRSTINDINTLISSVHGIRDEATNIVNGIEADINTARQFEQDARNSLAGDIDYLKSFVDLGSGTAFAAVEPFIMDILSNTAQEYVDYGIRALEVLEKLKMLAETHAITERPKKEPKVTFKGRDVNFPIVAYPKFFLGILASDFTIDTWNWAFDLRDVSSNPDLTNRPVNLSLGLTEDGGRLERRVDFNGSADFRTNTEERFNAAVNANDFPVSLGDQLSMVGINGFSGNTAFSIAATGQTGGAFTLGGDININQPQITSPRGTLAEAVDTAVREINYLNLGIQYNRNIDMKDEFKLTTNIGELIALALRRAAEAYARRAMDEIERVLRQKIEQHIDGRFVSKDEVDLLFRTARGDRDAAVQLTNALTNKRNEFEQRLRTAADDAVQQIREEATQAVQDLIQGQTPALPNVPRLPGR